jgi:flagellar hook-associated protein 3 FlgL
MRINPNPTADILNAIWTTQSQEQTALEQLSTGKRVNRPSDDPAAAAAEVQNQGVESRIDQYVQSAGSLTAMLQSADSSLSSVVTNVNQAISLGTEAANGTTSTANQLQIAQQVQGVLDTVVQLANTSFQGTYLFGGTASTQPPFTQTASGVTYNGNSGVNNVTIADGRTLNSNVPGDQIFQQSGADVMGSLQQLVTALQNGDTAGIKTATSSLSSALTNVSAQRVFYGNGLSVLQDDQTTLGTQSTNLKSQDNTLVGADTAKAATDLSNAELANQAALSAAAKIMPMTLLDYLPTTT